jgi:hypothetical protein
MINKKFDNFIESMRAVKLSAEEKSNILARTFAVIEDIESASSKAPVASPFSTAPWNIYFVHRKFVPSLVIVAILFVTGGASLAAEGALPGDSLYSVKVNVNEEVRGFTAVTPESKARVAVEATERRLQEVATLSARGKLTDQTKAIAQQEFNKRAIQVQSRVASLVSENNLTAAQEVAVNYESSLRAHEVILERISEDQPDENTEQHLSSFIASVKTELATTTDARVEIQDKQVKSTVDPKATAELNLNNVLSQTDETINMRTENNSLLSTTSIALVGGKISEAQVLTVKAEGFIASSTYSDAILILQQAATVLSDAQGIMSVEIGLDVDVKKVTGATAIIK